MFNDVYGNGSHDDSDSQPKPQVSIGRYNRLAVIREREIGLFLDGGKFGSILLPRRYVPEGAAVGDELDVFVYLDSEDDLIATTDKPLLEVGGIACLEVVSTGPIGAFLNWGLPKDLLLPFQEQRRSVETGMRCLVAAYLDNSNRIAASSKVEKFLEDECPYRRHRQVELLIAERTELGYKAVIDQRYAGLIHHKDVFRKLHYGQQIRGYIKQVRPDGKVDLLLEQPGYAPIEGLAKQVFERLQQQGGYLALSDSSDPASIKQQFGVSKKKFKMALGTLYKQRLISIESDGIRLSEDASEDE